MTRARTWKLYYPKIASYQIDFHLFYLFYLTFYNILIQGIYYIICVYFEDDDVTVGRRTRALKYTKINPISPPNTDSREPPRRIGANNKKMNEINPKIIYNA
jgi:hypothetical protein